MAEPEYCVKGGARQGQHDKMMELINATVQFVGVHSAWTFPVMFITAFGESFAVLGLLFPGTTIMVAAGLLVPVGSIPVLPLLAGSILGAVLGDGISWWLGRRHGYRLAGRWPFSRHPELLHRGRIFFGRYGALGVFAGRFFGPFRAVVTLAAGMMEMRSTTFWAINILSALVWAPALVLPGSVAVAGARLLAIPPEWRLAVATCAIALGAALIWVAGRMGWFRTLVRAFGQVDQ